MKLVITGTPGVGKTTIAKEIAKATGAEYIAANDVAKAAKCFKAGSREEVQIPKLAKAMAAATKGSTNWVAEGHLLCEVAMECDACLVLRCNPRTLQTRLKKRGYGAAKIAENALAEALDYCLINAESNYGNVIQLDATKGGKLLWKRALNAIKSGKNAKVDWKRELMALAEARYKGL